MNYRKVILAASFTFLGAVLSMGLLYFSMVSYGDVTISRNGIEGTLVFWLIPLAIFLFINYAITELEVRP